MIRQVHKTVAFPGFVIHSGGLGHSVRCSSLSSSLLRPAGLSSVLAFGLLLPAFLKVPFWMGVGCAVCVGVGIYVYSMLRADLFKIEPLAIIINGKRVNRYEITGLYLKIPNRNILVAVPQTALGDFSLSLPNGLESPRRASSDRTARQGIWFGRFFRSIEMLLRPADHEIGVVTAGKYIPLASRVSAKQSHILYHKIIQLTQSQQRETQAPGRKGSSDSLSNF